MTRRGGHSSTATVGASEGRGRIMAASLGGEGMGAATSVRTRTIVISGLLGAIQILLGLTGLGFIPMPTGVNATILHIPAIIAGALEGPVAGLLVGLIFGIFS